jgi:hypothetical protein
MKRKWNWPIWVGFIIAVGGLFSYEFFVQFPVTRDFPWVNLLFFAAAGTFLAIGLVRAFGRPQLYRGKIFGSIFAVLSLCLFALFAYGVFYEVRQVPPSTSAPHVGQKAPEFTLLDQNDEPMALADLVSRAKAVVLIFYRGFW